VPTHDEFVADVAAVYLRDGNRGSFGSGRLIAPDLILTAGHVVDYPTRDAPSRAGWKIALIREREKDGRRTAPAHDAELVWRGKDDLDLALLQLTDKRRLEPKLTLEFTSHLITRAIGEVLAAGFPEAWASDAEPAHDYSVSGALRVASQLGPYAWTVLSADKPDAPQGWKGMSGSGVCRLGSDDKLYLFGVVQEVPANFTQGFLKVARISYAFKDAEFLSQLRAALKAEPALAEFEPGETRADLGISRIFQTRTRAFTEEYLVSETGPVPFGGRENELRRLDDWLLDPQNPPRMLVTAPAGRGKSALLVRWMKNLQESGVCGVDGWQLVFMPISVRTGTNRPEVFYEGLARRLSEISGVPLPTDAFRDSEGFRYAVRDQLDRLAKPRVLIVIDGIDEALEGSFDPAVLPTPLSTNIRVLLSARWQVGDQNSKGWLERLGWDRGVKVDTCELDRLGAAQIADVLVRLGAPVNVLTQEPGLVERLAQLTEGEPLLVRYFAEDLWSVSSEGVQISRADLDSLKPGFDSYFKRWFELQEKLWKDEGGSIDRREVDAVLSVLAFALGPLGAADLLALVERAHGLKGVTAIDRLLGPLRRWVFGSGRAESGYILSHPKVGEYLQRNRFAAVTSQLWESFADWAKAHCIALNEGRLAPEEASPYCLQFLPDHLRQANAPPDEFIVMVENGWRCAWEEFQGGQRGFANAVRAAFSALRKDKKDLRIGAQWRCALTLSSITSLGQNLPMELLLAAVDKNILAIRQAEYFADLMGPTKESVQLLVGLADAGQNDPTLRSEFLVSALVTATMIAGESDRATALAAIAKHLPPNLASDAFATAKAIADEHNRATALAALAPHIPRELLSNALAAAKAIGDEYGRVKVLAALAPQLPTKARTQAISDALTAASAISYEYYRAAALAALGPHLATTQFFDAFTAAKAIRDEEERTKALTELARYLPAELLSDAVVLARAIRDEHTRAEVLAALAPHLPPELISEAFTAARAIDDEFAQANAIAALAPHLPPELLYKALAAAKAIDYRRPRARTIGALAPHLPTEQRAQALSEAVSAAKAIPYEEDRTKELAELARYLPPELLSDALAMARAIRDGDTRAEVLAALVPHLPTVLRSNALAVAKAIDNENARTKALVALAPHLSPELVADALDAAKGIGDRNLRAKTLVALAPHLPPELINGALAAAKAIGDEYARAEALTALTAYLRPERRAQTLSDALTTAKAIRHEYRRAEALASLAPHLPPEQRTWVLADAFADACTAAKAIGDEYTRAYALVAVARHLPPELLSDAFAAVKAIDDGDARGAALAALAPHLPPESVSDALGIMSTGKEDDQVQARAALAPHVPQEQKLRALSDACAATEAIRNGYRRAQTVAALAPHLTSEQGAHALSGALAAANAIRDDYYRSEALATLAPHLATTQAAQAISNALTAAKKISNEGRRSQALAKLAPCLPADLLSDALAAAKAIVDERARIEALAAIISRGGSVSPASTKPVLLDVIASSAKIWRPTALAAAAETIPISFSVGGAEAIDELHRAIEDVSCWYP
jgi:hypothetical protein